MKYEYSKYLEPFFTNIITEIENIDFSYNVICQNQKNNQCCYGFYNKETGNLSTGSLFERQNDNDLNIILDKEVWFIISEIKDINIYNVICKNKKKTSILLWL